MSIILKRVYRKENVGEITKENSYLIYAVMILLGLVAVVMSPGILNTYNFIFSHSSVYSSLRVTNVLNGMWGIIYKIAFLLFPCLLSFFFYRIYSKTNSKLFMVLAIGTLLFTTLGFSEGTSRNSALIPAMAAMFLLLKCFPKKKKTILISVGVIIVGGFIVMTTAKLAFINSYSGREMVWNLKGITNMIEAFAPVSSLAVFTSAKTGTSKTVVPAFLGLVPATIFVPYFNISSVCSLPCVPVMPCTMTRVS